MTAHEDQNGLREALARHFDPSAFQSIHFVEEYWGQRRRDAYRRADALIAGPLASLIADRASLRAAEAEITRLKEGMDAALRPFAMAADAYPISPVARRENRRQCEVIWSYGSEDNGNRREIAVSDLRNAAEALATLSPKERPHG